MSDIPSLDHSVVYAPVEPSEAEEPILHISITAEETMSVYPTVDVFTLDEPFVIFPKAQNTIDDPVVPDAIPAEPMSTYTPIHASPVADPIPTVQNLPALYLNKANDLSYQSLHL
jgi:hypothetical protein